MKNSKFRIVIVSFLTIIMLFAASCGNSFSSKPSDSDTAAVNLQIPPQIFKSIANREGISEDEIQNQSVNVFVNLFVDKNEPISQDLHDFDVKNGETITFPNIRVGASVWASASIMLENKIYSGSSDRKEVTENGVDLDLTLVLEKIYLELGIEDAIEAVKTLQDNANLKITGSLTQAQLYELIEEIDHSSENYRLNLDISQTTGLTELTSWSSYKIQSYSLPPSIQVIESIFFTNSGWIDNIEFPAGNENFIIEDNILYNADKTRIIRCITGKSMAESFTIPASVETIDDRAFYNCWYKKIIIPSTVKSIGDSAFTCSYDLQEFVVDSENPNYTNIDSCLYTKDAEELIQYPLGRLNETYSIAFGTKKIAPSAFYDAKNIKELTIPASVNYIGVNALNIEKLEKISFDDSESWVSLQDNSQLTQAQLENPKNYLYSWQGGTGLLVEGLTKREFSATNPLLTTESTNTGVLLNITNLNLSDHVRVYCEDKENSFYTLFEFNALKDTYSLLDKYVSPGTTKNYELSVNGIDYTTCSALVSGGLGQPSISAKNGTDGIELSVTSPAVGKQFQISRFATDATNQANITLYSQDETSVNKTINDYFVQASKEYNYNCNFYIENYDENSGVRYTPHSNSVVITAQSGLGELKIINKPVASIDYSSRKYIFTTPPQTNISKTLDNSIYEIGNYIKYSYASGSQYYSTSISYSSGMSSYDISWMFTDERYNGKTLSLVNSPDIFNTYESYVIDRQDELVYVIYQYDDSVDFSGLPEKIEIPAGFSQYYLYYDGIMISEEPIENTALDNLKEALSKMSLIENTDYYFEGNKIIFEDTALLAIMNSATDSEGASNPTAAFVVYNNKNLSALNADELLEFKNKYNRTTDYSITHDGKIIELTSEGYNKFVQSINQSGEETNSFNVNAVASDEGVKLSLSNLPVGGNLTVSITESVCGSYYSWDIFKGTITSNELVLLDKYVIANETIDYDISVKDATGKRTSIIKSVTATGGAGRFALTGTNVSEGVKIGIEKPSTFTGSYKLSTIWRVHYTADNQIISNAFFSFNERVISSNLSVTDSIVSENAEYYYFAVLELPSGYEGIAYYPHVKKLSAFIVDTGCGYGDFSILNKPEFTLGFADSSEYENEKLFEITYTTEPVFNTNNSLNINEIQNLPFNEIYLSLKYFDSDTDMYPCIIYNIKPYGQATERHYKKGSTLTLADSYGNKSYEIGIDDYPYADGEQNGIVSYYVEYRNTDSLDKLPQTIQVPSE